MTCATWIRSALRRYRFMFHRCLSIHKFPRSIPSPQPIISEACDPARDGDCGEVPPGFLYLLEVERVGRKHLFGPDRRGDDLLTVGILDERLQGLAVRCEAQG